MQLDVKTLSTYRLNRAKEHLEAAISNHQAEIYKLIDSAYRNREKCDYSDFFIASKEDSENQICNAKEFIDRVEEFLRLQVEE